MIKLLQQNTKLTKVLNTVVDLFVLQILVIVCSIPVFTIGASITALFSVYRRMRQESLTVVIRPFFKEFRDNFKQSTVVWIAFLLAGIVVTVDLNILYSYSQKAAGAMIMVPIIFTYFMITLAVIALLYIFPMLAWFQNGALEHIKNALKMGISNMGITVAVALIYVGTALLGVIVFPVVALFGISGSALLADQLFYCAFRKYLPKED